MKHPTDGTLRRLLDEPAGVADADRAHVAGCPTCLAELARVRADADVASASLRVPSAVAAADPGEAVHPGGTGATLDTVATVDPLDVDAAWRRLSAGLASDRNVPVAASPPAGPRWGARLRSPVVVVAGVVLLLTGAGIAAAADWLPIFRTEQIAPVTINADDVVALPDLSAFGDISSVSDPDVHRVADAGAAAAVTGLTVPQVAALPAGVTGEPEIVAGGQAGLEFTFSAAKAAAAVAPAALPTPPPGLDGSRFRLTAGPGVMEVWNADSGLPALAVGRAVAPTASSSGVDFATARDYVLSLPGLPADLVSQLGAFAVDGTTLPLPLPADLVSSAPTEVNGTPAQLLTSRDGAVTAVVWVQDGVVTAVGGSLSADEVRTLAQDLR